MSDSALIWIVENLDTREIRVDLNNHRLLGKGGKVLIDEYGKPTIEGELPSGLAIRPMKHKLTPEGFFDVIRKLARDLAYSRNDGDKWRSVFATLSSGELSLGDRFVAKSRSRCRVMLEAFVLFTYYSDFSLDVGNHWFIKVPDSDIVIETRWIQ